MSSEPTPTPATEVAAGLIFRRGSLLITQRLADAHLGGLWEFPGGKRQPGETYPQCLQRELLEELGVEVAVGDLFQSLTHAYREKTVHLEFYLCRLCSGEPRAIGCAAIAWVTASDLANYAFPAADARLLERLARSPNLWT